MGMPSRKTSGSGEIETRIEFGDSDQDVVVEYDWSLPRKETRDDPYEPGEIEITSVKLKKNGEEIADQLSKKDIDFLEEEIVSRIPTQEEMEADYADYMMDFERDQKLEFASENEALQYLADFTGKKIKIASTEQDFIDSYIETMLWSSNDENEEPLDKNYNISDISSEFMNEIKTDCKDFIKSNYEFIKSDIKRAGHDFWLTRNGHGAGFWDGDWEFEIDGKNAGKHLTEMSKPYGEVNVYVGDDGKIYRF